MTMNTNLLTAANGAAVMLPQALPGQPLAKGIRSPAIMPWPCEGDEIVPAKGYGLDLDGGGDRNAAEHWRYQTAYLGLTYAAGIWSIPANTELTFWTAGQGENVVVANPPAGFVPWAMSRSETDLYKGGAPVPRDFAFRIRSLGFAVGLPFGFPDPAAPIIYTNDVMDYYAKLIGSRLWDFLAAQFTFNEESCAYEIGLAQFHAMPTGKVSANPAHVRGGAGIGVVNMLPLRGSVWAGARDEADQLSVKVTTPKVGIAFAENPAYPLETDLLVPITFQAYGASYLSCPPTACAVPVQVSADQLDASVRRVLGK